MINYVFIALSIMIMVFLAVGLTAYGNDRPPFLALWMRSRLFATGLFVCMVIVYARVFGYPLSLAQIQRIRCAKHPYHRMTSGRLPLRKNLR